jgi:5-methylcytosine-specific restriction endonuclease McrA
MKKRWTRQEEQFVRENYSEGDGLQICMNHLSRPLDSVKNKAIRLGVAGSRRNFTDEEIVFIKANHQYLGYKKIAEALGVLACSVNTLACKLGLKMNPKDRGVLTAESNKKWKRTDAMKKNMSDAAKTLHRTGDKNPNWNGGVTPLRSIVDKKLWQVWKLPILARDGYSCVECGESSRLEVHHLIPYKEIQKKIMDANPGMGNDKLSDLIVLQHNAGMGITLCNECHHKITFGKGDELLGTLTTSGEDNQHPSQSNVRSFVDWKVQRLTGEESQTNKPDTSVANAQAL